MGFLEPWYGSIDHRLNRSCITTLAQLCSRPDAKVNDRLLSRKKKGAEAPLLYEINLLILFDRSIVFK